MFTNHPTHFCKIRICWSLNVSSWVSKIRHFIQIFKELINKNFNLPTKYFLEKNLNIFFEFHLKNNLKIIKISDYCSFNFDIWSKKNTSYILIKIQVSSKLFNTESLILDFNKIINQKHDTIDIYLKNIIKNFQISTSKIINICTDNCYAMKAAVRKFIRYIEDLKIQQINKFKKYLSIENTQVFNLNNTEILHLGCVIHLLQLVVKETINSSEYYKILIDKITEIAKNIKKYVYTDFYFFTHLPFEVRWNNIYLLIEGFLKNKEKYINCCNNFPEFAEKFSITVTEIDELKFLSVFLKKFFEITKKLEGEKY